MARFVVGNGGILESPPPKKLDVFALAAHPGSPKPYGGSKIQTLHTFVETLGPLD